MGDQHVWPPTNPAADRVEGSCKRNAIPTAAFLGEGAGLQHQHKIWAAATGLSSMCQAVGLRGRASAACQGTDRGHRLHRPGRRGQGLQQTAKPPCGDRSGLPGPPSSSPALVAHPALSRPQPPGRDRRGDMAAHGRLRDGELAGKRPLLQGSSGPSTTHSHPAAVQGDGRRQPRPPKPLQQGDMAGDRRDGDQRGCGMGLGDGSAGSPCTTGKRKGGRSIFPKQGELNLIPNFHPYGLWLEPSQAPALLQRGLKLLGEAAGN